MLSIILRDYLKPSVFILCGLPFAWLVVALFSDGLGPNPVQSIILSTGDWSLRFLIITLCVTPVRKITGYNALLRLRRMLGLYAFFYTSVHLFIYLLLDAGFDLALIFEDFWYRMYMTVGYISFFLLLPLAVTSNDYLIRRIGAKRWQYLHSLIYISALTGVLHYLWLVKADTREPMIYAAVFTLLMLLRLPWIARRLGRRRRKIAVSTA